MERPAGVTTGRRGLRIAHRIVRIVLVAALVVLLALIALHELRGLAAVAASRAAGGAPLPAAVLHEDGVAR